MPALKTVLARSVLLCGTLAALCMPSLSASAQAPIDTPILLSDLNFRDLAGVLAEYGGTGYADTTSHGGEMRVGVFYRSMALSRLSNSDLAYLSSLHLALDIDLRTPIEINSQPTQQAPMNGPDRLPAGATYINISILGNPPSPPGPTDAQLYINFVSVASQAQAFGTVLKDLASASGPVLYHCSFGKDRTGWTSMLLQTIAGVPMGSTTSPPAQSTIMFDYLASNSYLHDQSAVQQAWLQAGLAQINTQYGQYRDPMYAYLTQGLGLSQADIYVLRGKMVYYPELPRQTGFAGNAAAGAAFLSELQNSPLSGHYTAYNYYLQSAIDAGTLWGGETRAGGQVHADAAAYLMRQPLWIGSTISPYTIDQELRAGQSRFWVASSADSFGSDGGAGNANSTERSAGFVAGATSRTGDRTSLYAGIGYDSGTVASAGASAGVNTAVLTIGGRYAMTALEAGPYAMARADAGWVDYRSTRPLGSGLGTASGATSGAIYSGLAGGGYIMRTAPFTVTAQTGLRVTGVNLNAFNETGSELALGMSTFGITFPSILAALDIALDRQRFDVWTVVPSLSFSYERSLSNPQAETTGTLYGIAVSQYSAYDSRDLVKASFGIQAQRGTFAVDARGNVAAGDGAKSAGIGGQLSIRYNF